MPAAMIGLIIFFVVVFILLIIIGLFFLFKCPKGPRWFCQPEYPPNDPEHRFCTQCGKEIPLWKPSDIYDHLNSGL